MATMAAQRCLCHGYRFGPGGRRMRPDDGGGSGNNPNNDDNDDDHHDDNDIIMTGDCTVRCSVCIKQILQPYLLRHERALKDHAIAKQNCQRQLEQYHQMPTTAATTTTTNTKHNNNIQLLSELQVESHHLRERLHQLRKVCGDVAVRIAAQAVENDTHREQTVVAATAAAAGGAREGNQSQPQSQSSPQLLHRVDASEQRHMLHQLEQSLLEGSLHESITSSVRRVRVLRFQWAIKVLTMYRLYIDPEDIKPTPLQQKRQLRQQQRQDAVDTTTSTKTTTKTDTTNALSSGPRSESQTDDNPSSSTEDKKSRQQQPQSQSLMMNHRTSARGIAKIAGLPLPNAGPELYGVLPPSELVSALRLVASLTHTLARTLGIVLPHPIFLTMNSVGSGGTGGGSGSSTSNVTGGVGARPHHGDITELVSGDDLRKYRQQQFGSSSLSLLHGDHTPAQHSLENRSGTGGRYYGSNPFSTTGTTPSQGYNSNNGASGGTGISTAPYGTSSTSSLMSLMDGSYWTTKAKKALAKATGHHHSSKSNDPKQSSSGSSLSTSLPPNATTTFIPPSTDATIVAQRIHHATSVVLADSDESLDRNGTTHVGSGSTTTGNNALNTAGGVQATRFALSVETTNQDEFAIALQLLQNNVMVLCIRAGVPVSKLWPAEAMLLNLHELALYCQGQTAVTF